MRELGAYKASFIIPANFLNNDGYLLTLLIVQNESKVVYVKDSIATFTIVDAAERSASDMGREPSVVQVPLIWNTDVIVE